MSYKSITDGITLECGVFNESIGADKDLILINYSDFDLEQTASIYNRQTDISLNNLRGLTDIYLKEGAQKYIFEGTDYSVVPSVIPEQREDGNLWYSHSISFTVYSKKSQDRETLISLGGSIVIAVTKDRSTGLYELFGMYQGLRVSEISRTYTGSQNSNFYQVTISTPEIAVVKEPSLSELSVYLDAGTPIPPPPTPGVYGDATPTVQGLVKVDALEVDPVVYLKTTSDSIFARKDSILTTETLLEDNKTSITKWPAAKAIVDWITSRFELKLIAGTVTQYYRGDKTWQTLDKGTLGLGNVDNTSDINKPVSNDTLVITDNLQAQIDSIQAADSVFKKGDIETTGLDVHVDADTFNWKINGIPFTNTPVYDTTLDAATDLYYRKDLLLGSDTGTYSILKGDEDPVSASEPNVLPPNTIKLGVIDVYGANITGTEPVDLSTYVTQTQLNEAVGLEAQNRAYADDDLNARVDATENLITNLEENKADLVGGKVPAAQLPSYIDDIIEGYLLSNVFYLENTHTTIIPAESGKVYIDITTGQSNKQYRYAGSTYIQITNGLIASTDDVPQGATNKYSTLSLVLSYVLTGISFATGTPITATDTILSAFGKLQKQITDNISSIALKQDGLVSGTNIKTVNGTTILGSGNLVTPDMDTTTAQTVSGLKTYLAGMFGLRNVANTFTSFFVNANTASRNYTLQNRNGILADDTDIAGRMAVPSGAVNYIPKFITASTIGNSRIRDTGTFIGIDTLNTPIKDISLGYLGTQKEIGIEDSLSTIAGKPLIISAGRAINFNSGGSNFVQLGVGALQWYSIAVNSTNGDVYTQVYKGDIYKQTGGVGSFVALSQLFSDCRGIAVDSSNGDVFIALQNAGIAKQTGGVGGFVTITGSSPRLWMHIAVNPVTHDVYGVVDSGDIYKQTGGTGSMNALGQTSRAWRGIAVNSITGDVYATVMNGDIYKQTGGVGSFVGLGQTTRQWYGITINNSNGDVYAGTANAGVFKQASGSGTFNAFGQSFGCYGLALNNSNGDIYASAPAYDILLSQNNAAGTPDLNGGTLQVKAGTGKGVGQSRIDFITGQKTASGTTMQAETVRGRFDENGYFICFNTPVYANDAAADADTNLPSGAEYRITGNRTKFQKP